ncbi:MAG TPA: hypothetical protein VMR54_13175 [Thermoanaerobaculia bacterium]|nr:hypothetical protein [Thermoanaerobaculia bacterium]
MHPPCQSGFFTLATVLLAAASLACATTIPLPPELKDAEVIATTGRTRTIVMGKVKPPSMKPYVLQDLQTGSGSKALSHGAIVFGTAIGYEWRHVDGGFSFRLEKEGSEPGTLGNVTCVWGLATTSGGFSAGMYGAEFKIPSGSSLFCEFLPTMGIGEPWKLLLWTGAPSNPIVPDFPSGGVLARGDVRYAASSTNVIEPAGIHAPYMTGTIFTRDDRAVAAIERMLPSRVLVQPSLQPEERTLFVAMGAAIFVYDTQTAPYQHP